jgi:hypothetical protein
VPYLQANPTGRGHARQCKALRYRAKDPFTGERIRCAKYALKGGDYCAYHQKHRDRCRIRVRTACGQAQPDGQANLENTHAVYPFGFMSLSQTLRQRLAELENQTPVELIDLTEELKLAKTTMGDVAQLYDLTLLALENAPEEKQLEVLKQVISVGGLLRQTASEIGEVAGKAAGAMAACRHFVGVQNIPVLVNQMIQIMYDELGDEHSVAVARIAEQIKDVRLPNTGPRGTQLTPEMADEEARMMDSSVPLVVHESDSNDSDDPEQKESA